MILDLLFTIVITGTSSDHCFVVSEVSLGAGGSAAFSVLKNLVVERAPR